MKYFLTLAFLFLALSVNAVTLSGKAEFDWVQLSQGKRNELIEEYKNVVMSENPSYSREDFADKKKDKDFLVIRQLLKEGKEEFDGKTIVGFYKYGILIAYGASEKNEETKPQNTFYYSALGNLMYVDITVDATNDKNVTYQYKENGKLIGRIYNVSKYDQFVYDPEGEFLGRWYQEKMYNKNGKVTASRSLW